MSANLKIAKFGKSVLPYRIITDTTLGATPVIDVTQAGGVLYSLKAVHNGSAGTASYVKLFLTSASVTLGTTIPDIMFYLPNNNAVVDMHFPSGIPFTALSANVTDAANESATSVTNDVSITFITS